MAFLTRRYIRTYSDAEGHVTVSGHPTFSLSGVITDNADTTVVSSRIVCTINTSGVLVGPDGQIGVLLPVLDVTNTGGQVQPQGRVFEVSGEPNSPPWQLATIAADPNPCDLATKPPAPPVQPGFQWALESDLLALENALGSMFNIDGGTAGSVYGPSQSLTGGNASGH